MTTKAKRKNPPTFIPYGRQSIGRDDIDAVVKALKQDFLTQGPLVKKFEEALARYCGSKYAVAYTNGTAALHAACYAASVAPGDEGVTSPVSFAASANCLVFQGATPRFADVDPMTAQITADTVQQHITPKTKIIIPVDFAGRPSVLPPLFALSKAKGLKLAVDACHSLGADYRVGTKRHKVGSCAHADMTCFSFHPVKSITTMEGGAVTTNDRELFERLSRFRHHGITKNPAEYVTPEFADRAWYHEMQDLGYNYRLTDVQCALGISQLKKLDKFVAKRRKIALAYVKALKTSVGLLATDSANFRSAHHLFPILVAEDKREAIFNALRADGIGVQLHYLPTYRHPYYVKTFAYDPKDYPNTENYFRRTITLPVFVGLTEGEQKRVIAAVKKILI